MEAALYVERAIRRVVGAVAMTSKAAVATKAGLAESNLRDCGKPDWHPNIATLEKLERAAIQIEREFAGPEPSPDALPRAAPAERHSERKARRHPLFGALKGTFTIDPTWDLAQPAMPEWAGLIDEIYGPEDRR